MKNLKIKNIKSIQNINPNLNIPVGQIVLINVNKNRENITQQEPLDQVDNEIKDDDYLTKTKNTFTDKLKTTDMKYIKQSDKLAKSRSIKQNLYQTPKVIDQSNGLKHQTSQQNDQLNNNQLNSQQVNSNNNQKNSQLNNSHHSQTNLQYQSNTKIQQIDRQNGQSTISLNHHYEQPDLLLSKQKIIQSSDKLKTDCRTPISPPVRTTTNTPHYEKPITIKKSSVNMIQNNVSDNNNQLLDDTEINQIESFYRSQRTYVFVSRSMANLYFTQTDLVNNGRFSSPRAHEWTLSRTGVPLIIFNKGGTKCRLKRQLRFALAERGSGFQLFSDVIDNLTDYKKMHDSFHTFYLSCDHRQMAGLSFDCATSADEFLRQIESITSNPTNISLTGPKFYSKKSLMNSKNHLDKCKKAIKNKIKNYKKTDISMPCLFQHITNLDIKDIDKFYSLSTLVARALNPNYRKTIEESDNMSSNLSKLSIENLSNNSTNCDSSTKQIYKPYNLLLMIE